jgi:hemerythrin-like metal-binding protein
MADKILLTMNNAYDQDSLPPSDNPEASGEEGLHAMLQRVIADHQKTISLLQQTERAYSRLIPRQLLTLLERDSIVDVKLGDQIERKLTVMFADIRNFTPLSESMTPGENFEFINSYLSQMEPVIGRFRGIIDKYMGDTIMALFPQDADDAVAGSIAVLRKLVDYNAGRARAGYLPIEIGIGLNTGMVIIGTVGGVNRMDSTVIGDAVNLSSRIEEVTKTYTVPLLISQNTLYDLADPGRYDIRFLDRIRVKGKTQPLSVYEVFDNDAADLRYGKRASKALFEEAVACYHLKETDRAKEMLVKCVKIAPGDIPARIYLARCEKYLATGEHESTGELDAPLVWRADFQVGIEEVDRAHKALFDKVNEFIELGRAGNHDRNAEMLAFLSGQESAHFRIEEELMKGQDYPFAESHLQEHKRFNENVAALVRETEATAVNPRYLSFRIQLLLFDWFSGHVAKADRHMGRHLGFIPPQPSPGAGGNNQ